MKRYTLTLVFIALFCGNLSVAAKNDANKPNVIIIFVDDMGYGDPSCYGGTMINTPNIDQLADEGIKFTSGYVASPVCGPSRAGLLTGAYPNRFGVYWNPQASKTLIPESQVLLPNLVRSAGYQSCVVGKWNVVNDVKKQSDEAHDIMYWEADYWPREDHSYEGVWGGWDSSKKGGKWGPERDGDEYMTHRLTQHGVNFIEKNIDKPFFLYLAYNAPHSPLEAHKQYKRQVSHLDNEALQIYAAMVLAIDEGVGRINETLVKHGLDKNTLVIFASDNGPAKSGFKGYKKEWPEQILGSAGPLRSHKGQFYEGGIRIPFIMKWPDALAKNTQDDRAITTIDLYPTIAKLTGAKIPKSSVTDGVNVIPYLTKKLDKAIHQKLYWSDGKRGAIRDGDFKLNIADNKPAGLYDLSKDISEANDLTLSKPELVDKLFTSYSAQLASYPAKGCYNMIDNFKKDGYHPYGDNPPLEKVLE